MLSFVPFLMFSACMGAVVQEEPGDPAAAAASPGCVCFNPFKGTAQAFAGDKDLTCQHNNLCYVDCEGDCGDVEHATGFTAQKGRCVSKLACSLPQNPEENDEPVAAADDATVKLVDILTGPTAPTEEDEDEADVKEDDDANVEDDDDMTDDDDEDEDEDDDDEGTKSLKPLNDDVGENKKEDSVLVINRSAAPLRTYPWMTEPEHNLWYFREDPALSSFRNYWRAIFKNSTRDRRGEFFFYMHRQMVTRYNVEHLTHNIAPVVPFSPEFWRQPIPLGYDAKLKAEIGFDYQARPDDTVLVDLEGDDPLLISTLEDWYKEIQNAIKNMAIVTAEGSTIDLKAVEGRDEGISVLADAVESYASVNRELYGSLHNNLHMIIAWVLGPSQDDPTKLGVMGTTAKSIRDPMFFRMHQFIDDIFSEYKASLPAYEENELNFPEVEVLESTVTTDGKKNELHTFTEEDWKVELDGVEIDSKQRFLAKYTRMNNKPYNFDILVKSSAEVKAMVRVFLKVNGTVNPDAGLVVEMDRFLVNLNEGENKISRNSSESSVAEKRQEVLLEFDTEVSENDPYPPEADLFDGCGWPRHLMVPRGKPEGSEFSLVVMFSQLLPEDAALATDQEEVAKYAFVHCGLPGGSLYPDSRPMGFPFDRPFTWELLGNMASTEVKIYHEGI